MSESKCVVEAWRFFQNLTSQNGRPPNRLERKLLYTWAGRTRGQAGPIIEGIRKTGDWRGARGYSFRDLEQAKRAVEFAIEGWVKGAAVHPRVAAMAMGVKTLPRDDKAAPKPEPVPPEVVEALRRHRARMEEEMHGE